MKILASVIDPERPLTARIVLSISMDFLVQNTIPMKFGQKRHTIAPDTEKVDWINNNLVSFKLFQDGVHYVLEACDEDLILIKLKFENIEISKINHYGRF